MGNQVTERSNLVVEANPGPPLCSRPDVAANAESRLECQRRKRATATHDESGASKTDASLLTGGDLGFCLPRLHHIGQKSRSPRAELRELLVTSVAIEPDSAALNQE